MRLQSILEAQKEVASLDLNAVKIIRLNSNRYTFSIPVSDGARLWIMADVEGYVLTISDIQVDNADDHPQKFDTITNWDAYEVGIRVGTGAMRRVLRLIVDTVRKDHSDIRRIKGERMTGRHVAKGDNTEIIKNLREAAITLRGGMRVIVARNPSALALLRMLKRSESQTLRGLVQDNTTILWWDAHIAIHGEIAAAIGKDDYHQDRFDLRHINDENRIGYDDDIWSFNRVMAHPALARLTKCPVILFYAGSEGWLPGPEWVDAHTS